MTLRDINTTRTDNTNLQLMIAYLSFVSRYCHMRVDHDVSTAYCWSSSGDDVDWLCLIISSAVAVGDWCISILAVVVNDWCISILAVVVNDWCISIDPHSKIELLHPSATTTMLLIMCYRQSTSSPDKDQQEAVETPWSTSMWQYRETND